MVEERESSMSDIDDGVGELARRELADEVVAGCGAPRERIFCVMRVWEKGRACEAKGLE